MPITVVIAEPSVGKLRREAVVSSLDEQSSTRSVLVRVADESGHLGLGEAGICSAYSGETQTGAIALIREVLAPLVVGTDPFDSEWISRRLAKATSGNSFARAALEMAMLDLQGQILNVPLYRLLGGRDRPPATVEPGVRLQFVLGADRGIRLKFAVGAGDANAVAERSAAMTARGWKAIQLKLGHDPRADVERVRAVRQAIGPTPLLSVDAGGGYSVDQAVWAARQFEKYDIALFEQPTRRGDHAAMAEVKNRCGLPIMADESCFTAQDLLALIAHRAADVICLSPGKHAGIRATQQLAAMAEAAGIACTVGGALEREAATAAMAHVAVATPNIDCERFPGELIGPLCFEKPLSSTPLRYATDRLIVPEGPGLGIRLANDG